MRLGIAAAPALLVASAVHAQDLGTATPIAGSWSYAPAADGSEAVFSNGTGTPQVWVHCTRATRRVTISRVAIAAAPTLNVWTSSQTKEMVASFNPATGRLTSDFGNYDPLLDAIVSSRGRVGFSYGAQPALIVPAWAEIARVVEDCRV